MVTKLLLKQTIQRALILPLSLFGILLTTSCGDNEPAPDLDDLVVSIDVSSITFKTDLRAAGGQRIKAGQAVTFMGASEGDPDSWLWTFPGGTPETSTDQNPSVTWADEVGQVKILLEVTRSADGGMQTAELDFQIGPVEALDRSVFGLENQISGTDVVSKWFYWTPNDGTVSIALDASDGANDTEQSMKLTASSGYGEFQLRPHENGPEFLASLESNTTYVYSFYMKGSEAFTLFEASVLNVKNEDPKEGWYTPFWSGDPAYGAINITTDWKKFSYEFTTADLVTFADEGYADGTADNAGPFFKHFASSSGSELNVWIDEISLKEKEI
ncbi:MAG: PKD domain-containing protein [Reichenbachiella sp.]|uniref:PKD domain-containing protein n=1 Tax=Reichenbachiella sp. TaxID=2184521 RepID=UPI003265B36B